MNVCPYRHAESLVAWLGYNAAHLVLLGALTGASLLVFEPVTTMAEVGASSGPVDGLILEATPMTVVFIIISTVVLGAALARQRTDYLRPGLSVTTLTVLLGLNVSVIGLVDMSGDSLRPIVMFVALIVLLDVVYAAVFAGLQWKSLRSAP